MITSPNAYWLNFFLKRDINVLCWNYRGYGDSEQGFFENLDPYKSKRDVERVLAFAVNKLHLQGKLGVYGRSIGGITANHLASKYQDLIEMLIIDRSFKDLIDVAESKLHGWQTRSMFKTLTCTWKCFNAHNFVNASNCYKIISCDPLDDTVCQYSNIVSGVSAICAKESYTTREFQTFYQSLLYLFDYERTLYLKLDQNAIDNLFSKLVDTMKVIE
jgi:pimeloyl-ACP methyl ester carboxylesterase